jgi:vancomycin resistance protein YoaR
MNDGYGRRPPTTKELTVIATSAVGVLVVVVGMFMLVFNGRVLPGVEVNGAALTGMNHDKAVPTIQHDSERYLNQQIPVQYQNTTLRIPVRSLSPQYADRAVDTALGYGHSGSLTQRVRAHLRSFLGRHTVVQAYSLDEAALTGFIDQVDNDVTAPVANASLNVENGEVKVTPSQPGRRLDRGRLTVQIKQRIGKMDAAAVPAPVYQLTPSVTEPMLEAARSKAAVDEPLMLAVAGQPQPIPQATILGWMRVASVGISSQMPPSALQSFYPRPRANIADLTLDAQRVQDYAAGLGGQVNRAAKDAQLTVRDGAVAVASPSQDGVEVDTTKAAEQIIGALERGGDRTVDLPTKVTRAAVREDNLNELGLKELVSEGESFFPGSSSARLTNVRVGTARYDGVLIKPGEVFSFGKQLGEVGPAQGYQPSLVIIGNKEQKEYGGGLCQVSSTLYRAALLGGLPIVQRTNHSFAINEFYTAPYGVPGVDATIYYPAVDLKFKNDTPGYLLIQTEMKGTNLKFRLYGTKTKTGRIRGPEFVSGSMDATQPSKTVFYRDVLDLSGNVVRTDTTYTSYKSSTDFTVVDTPQFN